MTQASRWRWRPSSMFHYPSDANPVRLCSRIHSHSDERQLMGLGSLFHNSSSDHAALAPLQDTGARGADMRVHCPRPSRLDLVLRCDLREWTHPASSPCVVDLVALPFPPEPLLSNFDDTLSTKLPSRKPFGTGTN
ncbi:uncharacterized protein UTRI_06314 [Ustilago trichophora]|uniref:Uncharacterized protein n=1 Tax=Ustilago trichophora TaxID=86804 RepID=A0A5C3EI96_9BASI|nr:uncharacterized protein UTRI_06314 [Ustilago trichophora]